MTIKVGDRVRVIKEEDYDAPELQAGAVGTVGRVTPDGCVGVFIDGYREPLFNEGGWNYNPNQLEVVE